MLSDLNFGMICISETWCSNDSFLSHSNYNLSQYNSIHQERKDKRGGGVCVYINKKYNFKYRTDFSTPDENHETLSIEIIHKKSKNIIVNTCYRPPNAKIKPLKAHVTKIINSLCKKKIKKYFSLVILISTVWITQTTQKSKASLMVCLVKDFYQ